MRKKTLLAALAAIGLPALALAAQPLMVRFDGHEVPVHESVRVVQTALGPMRVRSWSWQGPGGAASIQVSSAGPGVMPAWALAQMRSMQAQMRQIQATLAQPFPSRLLPFSASFAQPALVPVPSFAPLVPVAFPQLLAPLEIVPQATRVIVVLPAPPSPRAPRVPAAAEHRGEVV